MAPKKNDENTIKKTPRKRVLKIKEEEPKKTPTVIRVKIPVKPFGLNGVIPKLNKKQLHEEKQLELANEVALAQFRQPDLTKDPLQLSLLAPEPESKPVKAKGKRQAAVQVKDAIVKCKRKKKASANNVAVLGSESEKELEVPKVPNKKATRKPAARKSAAPKSLKKLPDCTNNEKDTPGPANKKSRGRPKLIRPALVEKDTIKVEETEKEINEKPTFEPSKAINKMPNCAATRSLRKKMVPKRFLSKDANMSVPDTKTEQKDESTAVIASGTVQCNSTASFLSWTQDISTSSTTTCVTVTSNDFVRIDKKLPVLQMVPVQSPVSESSSSSGSSSSSSSDSEADGGKGRPDLSATTSVASVPRPISHDISNRVTAVSALVEEIASSLRAFEGFLDARFGRTVRPQTVPDDMMREIDTVTLCRSLRRKLSVSEDLFARPAPPRPRSERPAQEKPSAPETRDPDLTPDRARVSFEHEDDDALSLFAESITGIESSRVSTAVPEEYVPAPAAPPSAPRRYRPTRIEPRRQAVCEKHSADSTSVRDAAARRTFQNPHDVEREPFSETEQSKRQPEMEPSRQPEIRSQHSQHFQMQQLVRRQERSESVAPSRPALASQSVCHVSVPTQGQSAFFRGICFFYLALETRCRYDPCRFLHCEPNPEDMRLRLRALPDQAVLRELALVRSYKALRRRFAALFAAELARRGLTRATMEALALALAAASCDTTAALEAALMHLNSIDLSEVQDTLKPPLCDEMLTTLANTQNFSRFRAVFSKLAQFVAENKRCVPVDVAAKILERVCILPYDENLARAMLKLIKQTDPSIYGNQMMASFEKHLSVIGGTLLEEFSLEKALERRLGAESAPGPEPEQQERYTSPDTTHYDILNHVPISPMITRTVDLKRARTDTMMVSYDPTIPPPVQKTNYNDWRKTYPHPQRPVGPPGRPKEVRHNRPMIRPNVPMSMGNRRTITRRPVTISHGSKNNYLRMAGDYYD